jgi:hypothetical protein
VVLNQYEFSTDPASVSQNGCGVNRVVQNVHKETAVKGTVRKGQVRPVKCAAFNRAVRSWNDFNSLDVQTLYLGAKEQI